MATQKPLKALIPEIIEHVDRYTDFLQFNQRIYDVLEGQLRKEVEESLQKELFSYKAFLRAKERIPSINIMKKATDKLSKVYTEPPMRLANNKTDTMIMHNIARTSGLNSVLHDANRLLNAHNMVAIEPYVENGKHKFRALGGHQFLPFSDDPTNPTNMTVFIKLLGKGMPIKGAEFTQDGEKLQQRKIREVRFYALYSDDEFMIIDSTGTIRTDKMMAMGVTSTVNPFGCIPVVYKSKTSLQLIPYTNQEGFDIAVLVPKLLADLNYAAQFLSHSILWTRNADLGDQELNPDVVLDLGDSDRAEGGGDPQIGTVEPKVDIPNVLSLINFQVAAYFESIGIKAKSSDILTNGRDSSAVGKAIDEGDTTNERKNQVEMFRDVERKLWEVMDCVQDVWANDVELKERRKFSSTFNDTFRVQFSEMRPVKTERQMLDEIQLWRDQKLMTRKQALRTMKPDFTEEQIEQWIDELDKEAEENLENMLMGMSTTGPERSADGTFNEGNQAATEQNPDADPEM